MSSHTRATCRIAGSISTTSTASICGTAASHPADGDRRLVEAEPEVVASAAMADGVVLRRLGPAEGAGLERLFFELTTPGASTPSTQTDSIHPELAGATA